MLLECNHDREMLATSSYPVSLKRRIGGRFGHLANDVSAQILAGCLHPKLKQIVAAHLSRQNNRPELAREALAPVCGRRPADIVVADPAHGVDWLPVG
jgi:phosphoribosyl 1,2-cyclic phosphodiesterase